MKAVHVVILGTGQDAKIALDIFQAKGQVVLGFISTEKDAETKDINDVSVFAAFGTKDADKVLKDEQYQYFVAEGALDQRKRFQEKAAGKNQRPPATGIHPAATVSPYAKVGNGCMVNAGAVINANVELGDHTFVHSLASVEPDSEIGAFCTLSAGVRVGASCKIGEDVFLGTGAIVFPGIKIGKGAMVGAGSVVLKNVAAGAKVHGNPAQ